MRAVGPKIAILLAGAVMAFAQTAHLEGEVYIDHQPVEPPARNIVLKATSLVRTEGGRAEIRFANGGALFVGENTSVRLIDHRLQFEILDGSAVVMTGATGVAVGCDDAVELSESGVYRFDMRRDAPGENKCKLRVYKGSAAVQLASLVAQLMSGGMIHLNRRCGDMVPTHNFNVGEIDALDRWSRQRFSAPPVARLPEDGQPVLHR